MEMQWRKCWRMHRRFAVPEGAAASAGVRERDVAAAKTEDEATWRGGRGRRRVVMKQQGQQQMTLWGEQQIVPPLCFSDEEEEKNRKAEEAGAATKSRRTGKAAESALPEEKKAGKKRQQQSFYMFKQQQQQTQQQLQQELPYTKQPPGHEIPDATVRDEKSAGYSTLAAGRARELLHQTNETFAETAAGRTKKAARREQEDFQAAEEETGLATAAATETEEAPAGETHSFVWRCAKEEPLAEEAALPAAQQQRSEASTAADVQGLRVLPAAAAVILANATAPAEKGRTREKDQWETEPREAHREECRLKARSCCCAPLCSLRRRSCTYCTLGPPRGRSSCSLHHTQRDSSSVVVDAAADVRDQKTAAATGEAVCNGSGVLNKWATKRTWDEEEEEEEGNRRNDMPEQLLLHAASVSGWGDRMNRTPNEWNVEALPPGTAATVSPRRTVAPVSADAVSLSGKAEVVAAGPAAAGEAARERRPAAEEAVSIAHVEGGRNDKIVDFKGKTEAGQQRNRNSSWNKETRGEETEFHKAVQRVWTEQDEKSSNSSNFRGFAVEAPAAGSKRSAVKSNHRAGADVVAAVCAAVAVLRAAAAAEAETPSLGEEGSERLLQEGESCGKSEAMEGQEKSIGRRAADVFAVVEVTAPRAKGDHEVHHRWSRKRMRSFISGEGTEATAQSHALHFCSPESAARRPPAEPAAMAAPGKAVAAEAIEACRLGEQLLAQDMPSKSKAATVSSATAARAPVARGTAGAAMCCSGRRCCAASPWWLLQDQSLVTQQAELQEQQQLDSAAAAAAHAPVATGRAHAQQQRQPLDATGTTARPKGGSHCKCVQSAPHREGDVALIQAATLLDADPACGPAFAALAAVVPLASPAYLRPLPPLLPRRGTPAEEACTSSSDGSSSLPHCGCYCRKKRKGSWRSSLSCCGSCGCSSSTGGRNVPACGSPGVAALVSNELHTASSTGAKAVETAYGPPPQQQQGDVPAVTEASPKDGNDERLSTATLLVDAARRLLLSLGAAARAEHSNDSSNSRETPFPRW